MKFYLIAAVTSKPSDEFDEATYAFSRREADRIAGELRGRLNDRKDVEAVTIEEVEASVNRHTVAALAAGMPWCDECATIETWMHRQNGKGMTWYVTENDR